MPMKTGKPATRARPKKASRGRKRAAVELNVQYATRSRTVPAPEDFGKWVGAAMTSDARITVRLVGLDEGRALNRDYRGKDYATNVLTFVLDEGPPYQGDLALCAPVVSREARAQGKDVIAHYAHLTVHGVLHLQGHEHEDEPQAVAMEKLETRIMKRLGYADPYAVPHGHGRHTQ
ncbi:MAG TPA: rRNA maturation RNase YbeY [Burkholderiales bacterium]|nr:rRNA maturation RNase YbeY [Burkholderiales bacterium]